MIREETICFSGLPLETAVSRLRERGIEPQVLFARAPRGERSAGAIARVICASEDGRTLTAAYFAEPVGRDNV